MFGINCRDQGRPLIIFESIIMKFKKRYINKQKNVI